ncbi:site-specific integrase [Lysobacter enzymogenes]|uniref:site-specific integrase n=1 Tax=Lysobacter enzymogenes TaxID=69 RepID=UPI00339730C8
MTWNSLPWTDQTHSIRITTDVGIERTLLVQSTDLSIPRRRLSGTRLEEGLVPLSPSVRDDFLTFASKSAPLELTLMLLLGFFTGMRLGSICGLKTATLNYATPDPLAKDIWRLAIGPDAQPPVPTKFGVNGQPVIPSLLLDHLKEYAISARRLQRAKIAPHALQNNLFLSRHGNEYCERDVNKSPSVNVALFRLRTAAVAAGIPVYGFKFHDSRATFGTVVADHAIRNGGAVNALSVVKGLLLHKDEATSLKYIKFVEETPIKEQLANDFTIEFLRPLEALNV